MQNKIYPCTEEFGMAHMTMWEIHKMLHFL